MESAALSPMIIAGFGLVGIGGLIAAVFGVLLMVEAFKVSAVWGLAYLLVPFASLVFIIKYWDVSKKHVLMSLVGLLPMMLGSGLIVAGAAT